MFKTKANVPDSSRLNEEQVRARLDICKSRKIIDELYTTGKTLLDAEQKRIQSLESKAVAIAAFGPAIVIFLVSSSQSWLSMGNRYTPWIAFVAGVCGLVCTYFCIGVISPQKYVAMCQNEWLKEECLNDSEMYLKQYRILTAWAAIDSYMVRQDKKARKLQRALRWLGFSSGCLVLLLLQLVLHHIFPNHWLF